MDPEDYRKKIEQDILDIIEDKLRKGSMGAERAREIARFILDKLHPPLTLEQIYQIAPTLDDYFTELTKAVFPVIKDHDEKVKAVVVEQAEKFLKSGQAREMLNLLNKELNENKS